MADGSEEYPVPRQSEAAGLVGEGKAIVERLGGRWSTRGGICRCPAHDDREPSLSIRPGRSRLLFHCFAGCDAGSIFRGLAAIGLAGNMSAMGAKELGEASADRVRDAALRLWGASRPLEQTSGHRYLQARALTLGSAELRYHWRAPLGSRPFTRFRPALIAAVRDESGLVAVHRTFLDIRRGRVAATPQAKLALGPLGRGAVRLGGSACRIGLAEGLETALSASILFGLPCWATLGTERFRHVALPGDVAELLLFLDDDAGGRRAEALARESFRHIPIIEAHYPKVPGADWNDVLRARAQTRR